ncbi:flagellar basal-body rod protein FlgG [Paludibacterium paludis]|uniref:Flagellar basal-body rod protein FlgG n=1 Tax=Paludibacterium paludis TaxID=1225769 RepID=A0A918UBV1_9NEIS|nr:flagellar basal-body rod protein FlgG [Paludibacterium paludis]GGY28791.1 flagellar basal-body rod protein FlgG [Paludibacterium paludis]
MIDALYLGSSGMSAQQSHLETVANNLANMNTTGFKRSRVVFEDLMARETGVLAGPLAEDSPGSVMLGGGVRVASIDTVFVQGDLRQTDSPMDLAINGPGFVEVTRADGSVAYSRAGTLRVNDDGLLALGNGVPLNPPISVPADTRQLTIGRDGKVSVVAGGDSRPVEIGRVELAMFNSPVNLKPLGEGLYEATAQSGEAQLGQAGESGRGVLAQKYLEGSNVKMADEVVSMMLAQRAFEANAKIIQAADEMLAISNNLRRG